MRKRIFLLVGIVALLLAALPALAQDSGRICVLAFNDANENGVREPMEPLLADVAVYLQTEQAVVVENYVTTGQAEPYCFTGIAPGQYIVNFYPAAARATGQEAMAVTLAEGQTLPVQIQFGATPDDTAVAATTAVSPASDSNSGVLRLLLAAGGAGLIMVLFAALGVLVYWMRYRQVSRE